MSTVETRDAKKYNLGDVTIHICPACGVVNPAGPSDGCPHLQVIKFNGVDETLEELVLKVAAARKNFAELASTLKRVVMARVQDGSASVETPRRIKAGEVDRLYTEASNNPFLLTHPIEKQRKTKSTTAQRTKPKKKLPSPPLDSRQLDLLAYSPFKGNA